MSSTALAITLVTSLHNHTREELITGLCHPPAARVLVSYQLRDGTLIRQVLHGTRQLELTDVEADHGCVTCAVRDDLRVLLPTLAALPHWTSCVVILPAPVLARPVAEGLTDLADDLWVKELTCVLDVTALTDELGGDDLLADHDLVLTPADRTSVSEMLSAQLEEADRVVLSHLDQLTADERNTVQGLVRHLAPLATQDQPAGELLDAAAVLTCTPSGARVALAREQAPVRRQLVRLAQDLLTPAAGVDTQVWSSARPLHPGRLHEALSSIVRPVLRSTGMIRLAGRGPSAIRWASAGGSLSIGLTDQLCTSSELVLTGIDLDGPALIAALNRCCLTDRELRRGERWWSSQPSPFDAVLDDIAASA
jgi:G3E family GTPase